MKVEKHRELIKFALKDMGSKANDAQFHIAELQRDHVTAGDQLVSLTIFMNKVHEAELELAKVNKAFEGTLDVH